MNDGRSGKVDVPVTQPEVLSEHGEPAAPPGPVRVDRIDQRADEYAEHGECRELPPLGQRARRNRGRRVHEDHLEQEVGEHRRGVGDASQEESRASEQAPRLAPDGQRDFVRQLVVAPERPKRADAARLEGESDRPVGQHRDAVDHEVHGDRVRGVFCPREAGLHHREPGLHEHHEEPGDESPHEVDGDGVGRGRRARGLGERVRRWHALSGQHKGACDHQEQTKTKRARHTISM